MSPVRRRKRLREIIRRYKDRPCQDCGLQLEPESMTYDHCYGKKVFNLGGSLSGRSEKDVLEEIAKCEIVCRACHDKREEERRR